MDILKAMKLFVKVIELNSFTATAERMNVAHSTISKQINNLESNLSVQLINRTTRKIRPTEAGLQFYQHCVRIIGAVDTAWSSIDESNTVPVGNLLVSAPVAFSRIFLGEVVVTAKKRFPDLEIDIRPNDDFVDLVENGYDLTIRIGDLEDSTCIAQRIYTSRMVLCASSEYIDTYGEPQSLKDLESCNCLTYSSHSKDGWSFFDKKKEEYFIDCVNGSFQSDSCDLLCQVAVRGEGVIYLPDFIVNPYIIRGELFPLLTDFEGSTMPIYVVYPPGKSRPEKVRVFVSIIKSVMEELEMAGSITIKPLHLNSHMQNNTTFFEDR